MSLPPQPEIPFGTVEAGDGRVRITLDASGAVLEPRPGLSADEVGAMLDGTGTDWPSATMDGNEVGPLAPPEPDRFWYLLGLVWLGHPAHVCLRFRMGSLEDISVLSDCTGATRTRQERRMWEQAVVSLGGNPTELEHTLRWEVERNGQVTSAELITPAIAAGTCEPGVSLSVRRCQPKKRA